nr:epidermal growth factor receptor-like isoform X1 [Biomphalaria glabrata]
MESPPLSSRVLHAPPESSTLPQSSTLLQISILLQSPPLSSRVLHAPPEYSTLLHSPPRSPRVLHSPPDLHPPPESSTLPQSPPRSSRVLHAPPESSTLLQSAPCFSRVLHAPPKSSLHFVCFGTAVGLSVSGDAQHRYNQLVKKYKNCQIVLNNLEIVGIDDILGEWNMDFLSDIEEVEGYVLLALNYVEYIPLTKLKVIRGHTLYSLPDDPLQYSLFVSMNYDLHTGIGLKELRFKELTEILNGMIYIDNNHNLCFENTIAWHDIIPAMGIAATKIMNNSSRNSSRICGQCHSSCNGSCWGSGSDMCQKLTSINCHPNCGSQSRCFGPNPNQCCSPECAAGCFGPRKDQCFSCRNFKDNQTCESSCTKTTQIYDKTELRIKTTSQQKVTFGIFCRDKCPDHLLKEENFCVKECSNGKYTKDNKNCEQCIGPCPRVCKIDHEKNIQPINIVTLMTLKNCTVIDGNLIIQDASFNLDQHYNISGIHPHNLTILKDVKEITGYVMIQSNHSEFTNLSFLSNLKTIYGRQTSGAHKLALSIILTPLKSLELNSLKSIINGNVHIFGNRHLCYANTVDWSSIVNSIKQVTDVRNNRDPNQCANDEEVCDSQCGVSGCWGKGPSKCVRCANFVYSNATTTLCLENCDAIPHLYHKGNEVCEQCHAECEGSCIGPTNRDCHKCAHVAMLNSDGQISCEPSCGESMYPNETKYCLPCHPFCRGCTGPEEVVKSGGCTSCVMGQKESPTDPIYCINPEVTICDAGYFQTYSNIRSNSSHRLTQTTLTYCERCHHLCENCTLAGPAHCDSCKFARHENVCESNCPSLYYMDSKTKDCFKCHEDCRGRCFGPSSSDCAACANFKVYVNSNGTKFNCTKECPPELPYKVKDSDMDENNRIVCADTSHPEVQQLLDNSAEEEKKLAIILGCTIPGSLLLLGFIIGVSYFCHKRAQNNMKAAEFTAKITGHEDIEPLTPTNTKPDLSKMRIINEEELRKGAIIGSGAFGTVYKGIWIPQGENVKIPVAIKILQEGTSPNQSIELLEEARVMCSVEHMCCVRILAVCLNYQMMLITQLMPHGNLLNYIRTNAQHIGSKSLLTWCTQIARGMAYLEERGIVHRDLAARNVLVQTQHQVKITDFGLAKLLNNDNEVYQSSGGLMPIKWLALECINHRIFTHKSDVWSFGVTLWELFTLGKKPYESVRTKDVPLLLEKGERLQQPSMCTIDVYMIMVKCWMLEAESRPTFKELVEEFAKMSRDPGRYLVIEGDELMRLPSVSYDKNDLVTGMTEDAENVVEAEEYLQPIDPRRLHRPISLARQHSNMSSASHHFTVEPTSPGAKSLKSHWDNQKIREKKYGHLNAAAKAKQERELPHFRGDSVNSRYSSDPIRYLKDKEEVDLALDDGFPDYTGYTNSEEYSPQIMSPKLPQSVLLPVDKDDYLQPGAAAQSLAYLDLDGKGYYQNEKDVSSDDPFDEADPMLNQTSDQNGGKHLYFNYQPKQVQAAENAVANPVYFDNSKNVWEPKWPRNNGYQAVPTVSMSPVHNKAESSQYYKPMNGGISSSVTLDDGEVKTMGVRLKSGESKV